MREEESIMIINNSGDKYWINKNGELHRLNGPAVEYSIGEYKAWYQNGSLHRINGPAIAMIDGINKWIIKGESFESKEAFFEALTPEEKEIALFSEDFHNA